MSKSVCQNVVDSLGCDSRVHTTLNHISICLSTSKKMFLFFRARAEKGIAGYSAASSVVWTLIDNGKLTNQIARLAAIVLKT